MTDYIIVGGGISGLSAALHLSRGGQTVKVLEASSRIGGRIKTDVVDGYLLDRGFQVYLDAYPEGKLILDYKALKLKKFISGAKLFLPNGSKDVFVDPLKHPKYFFTSLSSSAGDFSDKLNLYALSRRLSRSRNRSIFKKENKTTSAIFKEYGFSDNMIKYFLQPFYAGIFLESNLSTSRRMFDFVLKMFKKGNGTVPVFGMEEIPKQMAGQLPQGTILTHQRCTSIVNKQVKVESGESYIAGKAIILATENPGHLLEGTTSQSQAPPASTTCVYFSAPNPPYKEPLIGLFSHDNRIVNNMAVMSNVSREYAPSGDALISLSLSGDFKDNTELIGAALKDISPWFPSSITDSWTFIKTYHIPHALPNQSKVSYDLDISAARINDNLYTCGDYMLQGSINGALRSGRQLAEYLLANH